MRSRKKVVSWHDLDEPEKIVYWGAVGSAVLVPSVYFCMLLVGKAEWNWWIALLVGLLFCFFVVMAGYTRKHGQPPYLEDFEDF
ncbi:MAG: hypothetical protein IAF02_16505 [Anaerolineae bacterium]|nr:hypothetical protein [Anaerolineae bacterium]